MGFPPDDRPQEGRVPTKAAPQIFSESSHTALGVRGLLDERSTWNAERRAMWFRNWKRVKRLEDEMEPLARTVRLLEMRMDDLQERTQRLGWRVGKLSPGASAAASTGTSPADSGSTASGAAATASPATDPISAALLQRRKKRGGPVAAALGTTTPPASAPSMSDEPEDE